MADEQESAAAPVDDKGISDETWALRRVHLSQVVNGLPDSSVFKSGKEGIGTSVTLNRTEQDIEILLKDYPAHGVVAIKVGAFREQELGIAFTHEDGNPNHCEVFGGRTKGKQKALATQSRWVIRPQGLDANTIAELFTPPFVP